MPYGAGAEKCGGGLPGKDFYLRSLRCGGGGAEELILKISEERSLLDYQWSL